MKPKVGDTVKHRVHSWLSGPCLFDSHGRITDQGLFAAEAKIIEVNNDSVKLQRFDGATLDFPIRDVVVCRKGADS